MDVTLTERLEKVLEKHSITSEDILKDDNKKKISEVMNTYQLNWSKLEQALLWSITEGHPFDIEKFKGNCNVLSLVGNKETKEDVLIGHLETMSVKQLLEDLSYGKAASNSDLKMIKEIETEYQLTTPVMNVLIHFVLLQTNMKLSKVYLKKIASHWSRAELTTAREAMTFARKQIDHTPPTRPNKTLENVQPPGEKPFTVYEYRYIKKLDDKYKMDFEVAREIMLYGRKVNQGLMVFWFLEAVSDFIDRHNGQTAEDTKDLLHLFHKRFVENFGKE